MRIDRTIQGKVSLIDSVLFEIGERPIAQNENFKTHELHFEDYLNLYLDNDNTPYFGLIICNDFVRIDIDTAYELPEFPAEHIDQNPEAFKEILREIFTSRIVVKKYGNAITKVVFLDNNNIEVRRITIFYCFPIFLNVKKMSYSPLMPASTLNRHRNDKL